MRLSVKNSAGLKLPAGKMKVIYFDADVPGFGLRLREGARNWIFQYNIGSKQRRMTLGKASALDVTKARASAEKLYAKVRLGIDPAGEVAEAKANASETFEVFAR